ncbi:MAG: hypothetical protein EZS28_025902, partial [Streblomastix strix]
LGKSMLDEFVVKQIAWEILLALQRIHQQGYIHGNLKLDNIIFRTNPKTQGIDAQLCNFSLGRQIGDRIILKENGPSCMGLYYAPEALNANAVADPRMDMFSFGLVLYLMLTKNHPLPGLTLAEYVQNVNIASQTGVDVWFPIDEHVSPEAADLVTLLLNLQINRRITVVQALQAPFFPQEWRNMLQPDGIWLKWRAEGHQPLPKELFDYAYGEGNSIANRVKLVPGYIVPQVPVNVSQPIQQPPQYIPGQNIAGGVSVSQSNPGLAFTQYPGPQNVVQSISDPHILQPTLPINEVNQDVGGKKRRRPPPVTPDSFIPTPTAPTLVQAPTGDYPPGTFTPAQAMQVVYRMKNYIPPLQVKLDEFNQRRRAELVRVQGIETNRIQFATRIRQLPPGEQADPLLLIDNIDEDDQVDQDLLRMMSKEEYDRVNAMCDVISNIVMFRIVPVDKAIKDALTMKGTFIDATELVKGEGNEMMHRDGIFELSLKLLWPLIRKFEPTTQPATTPSATPGAGSSSGQVQMISSRRALFGGGGQNTLSSRRTKRPGGGVQAVGPGAETAKPGETFSTEILDMVLLGLYNILTIGIINMKILIRKIN